MANGDMVVASGDMVDLLCHGIAKRDAAAMGQCKLSSFIHVS